MGRETAVVHILENGIDISIHSLRGEGDTVPPVLFPEDYYFNPLPPWGGRLYCGIVNSAYAVISIHSLRGEGDIRGYCPIVKIVISIHSLRGEGDSTGTTGAKLNYISIHSLRGEGDEQVSNSDKVGIYFNPLPPWGGRRTIYL